MELRPQPSFGLSLISRPMLGCLDQVPPPTKTGLNNPNQLKLGSRGGLRLSPRNVWDFVAGI